MRLKSSALLGCHLWENSLSMTNPVYFVDVCGGENLAWHQMPFNRCFPKQRQKKKKMATPSLPSAFSLLVSCLTSTLNLSRLSYICQEHGLYVTPLPWLQLLYWAGHVFTVYIMGCWEKRGRTGVLVPLWCHIQVCETVCFLCLALRCSEQEAL